MSQVVNIVINDGAGSPVAHTFSPIGKDDKGVLWLEQTTPAPANPLGAKRIGYKQNRVMDPKGQLTGKSKAVLTLQYPILETLGTNDNGLLPPPTVSYVDDVRIEFTLPERSLKQERKDTRVLAANLLANAQVVAAIDDLNVMY